DRYRTGHLLQQWQVIYRVAVEGTVFQSGSVLFQPAVEAGDFAFLEARHISGAPGIAAILHFAFGGQQGVDAETRDNRRGDETVGRGDDQYLVAGVTVLGQQRFALGEDDWLDAIAHELAVPLVKQGHLR